MGGNINYAANVPEPACRRSQKRLR